MDRGSRRRAVGSAVPRLERAHHGRVLPAERLGARRRRARPGRPTIVDNYEHLSFNVGPTLLSWLETPPSRGVRADARRAIGAGGGAIAQAYNHMILPLANERDVRTQIRWGLADFAAPLRPRAREGMWLPETAVNDDVLRVLVDEGVGFTILAPSQADGSGQRRRAVSMGASGRQWPVDRPSSSTTATSPTTLRSGSPACRARS